ncbi:MAG TPA: cytochrome P450 [Acidimicrobiales bacterium]|nr:cytochrome P450 [Acidimicrobiales bacterium]
MAEYASIDVDIDSRVAPATEHWKEIDRLREQHRYFWNRTGGYWVLTRYEDIREAFNTPEIFSNRSIVATDPDPSYRFLPSFSEPPQHMKYRHLMNRWFAPASIARHAEKIAEMARQTILPLVPRGRADFITAFGDGFPVKVFLLMMGLPLDDADFFVSAVHRMSGGSPGVPSDLSGWEDIARYWAELLADRRSHPGDPAVDFVTHLSRCQLDGAPLPDADILDILVTLTLGSLDTVKNQLGWCFYHLATHPPDRRRIVADPELVPTAIEEFLRAYPIVGMARKLTQDVDFHGCPMKKDQMVLLSIPAATRDPRQFPDADQVLIGRTPNRHIAFGASEHRCLGSHLARQEMQAALREWHGLIPEYRLDTEEPLLAHGGLISLPTLPLAWD